MRKKRLFRPLTYFIQNYSKKYSISISLILKKEHRKSSQFKTILKGIEPQKHDNFKGFGLWTPNDFALDTLGEETVFVYELSGSGFESHCSRESYLSIK